MKHLLLSLILFLFFSNAFSQTYNPQTGALDYLDQQAAFNKVESDATPSSSKMQSGITCNPSTFWAHNGQGSIVEYSLI
jgi:hypothetical protein